MKAIILAAGENNEVAHLVGDIPKSLIPIEESTIFETQLNVLHSCGIDRVAVVRGFRKELFDMPSGGVSYYENDYYKTTHILYTLFCAEDAMDEDVIILYGDVIVDKKCLGRLMKSEADIAVGVVTQLEDYKKRNMENLEIVYFDADNHVYRMGKKQKNAQEVFGQFSGLMKCSKRGIEIIKANYNYFKRYNENYKTALISELLDNIIQLGIGISSVILDKGWLKINSEEDYKRLLEKQSDSLPDVFKMKTDWALRSKMYDNIGWVNVDEPLDAMIELSHISTDAPLILDVGVGTGKVLKHFKKYYSKAEGYGIDISREMMDKIDPSYKFNLSVANVEDLSIFPDEMFDIVTARMSFHHVTNLEKASKEVYRVLKKGGSFTICEGVPPDKETIPFYKEVFSYKENRNTFLTDDLINLLQDAGFYKVTARSIVVSDMSMNNWLANAGIPYRNKDIIAKLHYNCSESVKKSYKMKFVKEDILMEWKFVVVNGVKKL